MVDLSGKTALITGGAGGIGLETARVFVDSGVTHVALVDINEEAGQAGADELKQKGAEAIFIKADVSDPAQVEGYVKQTAEAFGKIDIFFNNAGYEGMVAPIQNYTVEAFDKVMGINVKGMWLGLKYVIPVMLENGGGAIVNTASVAGLQGTPTFSAYGTSKWATVGLTKSVAGEVAAQGIRVNAVCPSPVDNRMMRSLEEQANPDDPEGMQAQFAAGIPMGRYATNKEIATAVAHLVSDDASFITGAIVPVDGGMTA